MVVQIETRVPQYWRRTPIECNGSARRPRAILEHVSPHNRSRSASSLPPRLGVVADPGTDLRVLRTVPSGEASPTTTVTVTFDRPVAGSLDRIVDPRAIFSSARRGRDGRLARSGHPPLPARRAARPERQLHSHHRPTASPPWTAAASASPTPSRSASAGPRVLAGSPVGPNGGAPYLTPDARFDLVVDAPVDPAVVEAAVYVEFSRLCAPSRRGPPREWKASAPSPRTTGGTSARPAAGTAIAAADPLRRVVRLAPRSPLPHGCAGELVVPASFDGRGGADAAPLGARHLRRLPPRAGELRVGGGVTFCPTGPLVVRFTTPVRGADVLRHITLRPAVPIDWATPPTSGPSGRWTRPSSRAPPTPSSPTARSRTGSASRSAAIRSRRCARPATRPPSTTRRPRGRGAEGRRGPSP